MRSALVALATNHCISRLSATHSWEAYTTMETIHLTLVRHGETDANVTELIQGWDGGNFGLNANGRGQADRVGERLAGDRFDAAYCSDLQRTQDTARAIVGRNDSLGRDFGRVQLCPLLRERGFGSMEGRYFKDLKEQATAAGADIARVWDFTPEGGETLEEVRGRGEKFFQKLIAKLSTSESPPTSILVVSHGRYLQEFIIQLHKSRNMLLPVKEEELAGIWPPNTAVSRIKFKLNRAEQVAQNLECTLLHCGSHLEG